MNKLEKREMELTNEIIARPTKWNEKIQKLFYITLASANIDYGVDVPNNVVAIKKKDVFDLLGVSKDDHNRHYRFRMMFQRLRNLSEFHFGDNEHFEDGFLIYKVVSTRNYWHVYFDKDYIDLVRHVGLSYTKILLDDVVGFNSKYSMLLYQALMQRKHTNVWGFTTKNLKDVFGLDKDDYVYKGRFKRKDFEDKTIRVAVKEINEKSKTLEILEWYKKYDGRNVIGYVFKYYIHPMNENREVGDREINALLKGEKVDKKIQPMIDVPDEIKNYNWWD